MSLECELTERRAQSAVALRTRTPQPNLSTILGPMFGRLANYIVQCGENPAGAPYIAYYNMDMQDLDIEVGFPVTKPLPAQGDFRPVDLPAGPCATLIYKGPYSGLGSAYNTLTEFVRAQGRVPTGASYEFYLNDPSEVPPEELLTQIVYYLEPA